ncbi:CsgG/HfaB family protein [Bacteroidales bacterium OttesenSCG-928-J16]|nr:CsgG/HfaB family protein [Bacteroidales bacterium OttesenSCG-928-J16]
MKRTILLLCAMAISLTSFSQEAKKVAVFDPVGTVDEGIKIIVREEISSVIVTSDGYTVLERSLIDKVLEENRFQMSGMVDDSQVGEIGKKMGANYVCVSSISSIGTNFYISCKLIDVNTARVEIQKTGRTTKGYNDIDVVALNIAGEMFKQSFVKKEATSEVKQEPKVIPVDQTNMLKADKKNIYYQGRKLNRHEIQNLYKNMDASRMYEKGYSQNRKGKNLIIWGSVLVGVGIAGSIMKPFAYYESYSSSYYSYSYDNYDEAIGIPANIMMLVGYIGGSGMLGGGIGLKVAGNKNIKKSVESYNREINKFGYNYEKELKLGLTQGGIGFTFSF